MSSIGQFLELNLKNCSSSDQLTDLQRAILVSSDIIKYVNSLIVLLTKL